MKKTTLASKVSLLFLFSTFAGNGNAFAESTADSFERCVAETQATFPSGSPMGPLSHSFSQCVAANPVGIYEGASAARLNDTAKACNTWSAFEGPCREFANVCQTDRTLCKSTLKALEPCLKFQPLGKAVLETSGIANEQEFADWLADFRNRVTKCSGGKEYLEQKKGSWWNLFCNDFSAPQSDFYELNGAYYQMKTAAQRAALINGYAASEPSAVTWQKQVANIILLDALEAPAPDERAAAAKALHVHGDFSAPVLYGLIRHLSDDNPQVRAESALALRTQGNRSALVVFSLLQKLSDASSIVRGNAALALREQALEFPCEPSNEARYFTPEVAANIETCKVYDSRVHPNPDAGGTSTPGYQNSLLDPSTTGCPEEPDTEGGVFDAVTTPEDLKQLNLASLSCKLFAPTKPAKVKRIVETLMLQALTAETDPVAKERMIYSLRTLAMGSSLLTMTLKQGVYDPNFRIRRASIFALVKAGAGQDWAISALKTALTSDTSPSVRKAALLALTEMAPLDVKLNAASDAFANYVAGVRRHSSQARDCSTSRNAKADEILKLPLNAAEFFSLGFSSASSFYNDIHCDDQINAGVPALLWSHPTQGQLDFRESILQFKLRGVVPQERIKSLVRLTLKNKNIDYALVNYKTNPQGNTTQFAMQPLSALVPDQYYAVTFLMGFGATEGTGWRDDRNILFRSPTVGAGDAVVATMNFDPDSDVRYAAAEALQQYNPEVTFHFLVNEILKNEPESAYRASKMLASPSLSLSFIESLTQSEKMTFLQNLFRQLLTQVDKWERLTPTNPPLAEYLTVPAIATHWKVIHRMFESGLLSDAELRTLDTQVQIKKRILDRMKPDYPPRNYTMFERQYLSAVRPLWLSMYNTRLKTAAEPMVERVVYETLLLSEKP
jgi:HEAT repeat protein